MPLDFPNTPSNGSTYTADGVTWQYDGEKWIIIGSGTDPVAVSASPPTSPGPGDAWFDTDSGTLLVYYDGFWVAPSVNYSIGTAAVGTAQIADGAVTTAKLDSGVAVPTGSVMTYAGTTAPTGWLLCDGSEKAVATYPALDSVLGTTYGSRTNGSGGAQPQTHFRLPDLRGRVPAGRDDMGGTAANRVTSGVSGVTGTTLGAAGGDQSMQSHRHWYDRVTTSGGSVNSSGDIVWAVSGGNVVQRNTGYLRTDTAGDNTGTGSSQNVQPTLILNYIIKT